MVDLKARGAIVVLIAHRPSILAVCDQVLLLANGTQQEFGPRDEILRKVIPQRARAAAAAAAAGNLKVVGAAAGTIDRFAASVSCFAFAVGTGERQPPCCTLVRTSTARPGS